jgi:hypothetical protein
MQVSVREVDAVHWVPGGMLILYARNENGIGNPWPRPIDDGEVIRKLTAVDSTEMFTSDVSCDNRLVISCGG